MQQVANSHNCTFNFYEILSESAISKLQSCRTKHYNGALLSCREVLACKAFSLNVRKRVYLLQAHWHHMITVRKGFFQLKCQNDHPHKSWIILQPSYLSKSSQYDSFNCNIQLYFDTKLLLQFLAFLNFFQAVPGKRWTQNVCRNNPLSCNRWSGLSRRDQSTDAGVDRKINRSLIGQQGFNAFKAKLIAHEAITRLCVSTIQSRKGKEWLWRWRWRRRGRQQHSATGLNLWKSVQGT